ncbi:rhomboid family intramembrane serine protease [Prolixibacter sp. SD074]|uniref:rhomboid family intramembrane serine protease n=1 Tax=Prolixibacter sp. SD074 TaxID=2652391 RepID=UPI00126EB626|nr:rhomboid family intramembrane serine protease [Prolixibacter sp. SD074]GET30736.1 rhomboid family intramembrane serine protease [Prolixibacter sp. SD074]
MTQFRPPSYNAIPPVVKNLIMLNVLMLVATWALKSFGIDLTEKLALYYPASPHFQPYQFVTHMFMHGGFMHLFFNMFALYMFGRVLEMVWGPKRFLIFYFVTGLGAAAFYTLVNYIELSSLRDSVAAFINTPSPELLSTFVKEHLKNASPWVYDLINNWMDAPNNPAYINQGTELVQRILEMKMNIPVVGASGAIFGVLLAFGMLFPNTQLMLLFPPIPIKAKYFVIGYGVIELFLGVRNPGSDVAHFAHLGGMIFGFILIKFWNRNSNSFY